MISSKMGKWRINPDIDSCIRFAKLYNIRLDDLVNFSEETSDIVIPPKGKYFFSAIVVGEWGQIVTPKEARELFNIKSGYKLLILGYKEKGLGIVHQRDLINFIGNLGVVNKIKG